MRFVTHEVLPSIRKTGSYLQKPQTYIEALQELIVKEQERLALEEKTQELKAELDESKDWFTIKRVAALNGISWKKLDWKRLKNTSQAMEREVKKIFDANYSTVNSYHIDVW
jgi:prophage antirepressor-like protein